MAGKSSRAGSLSYFHWALLTAICTSPGCENLSWGEEDATLQVEVTIPLFLRKWVPDLASGFAQALELLTHMLLDTYEGRKLDFLRLQMYQQGCAPEN